MNIVADENIPYAREAFASFGQVTTLPGRSMQQGDLLQCDCLLVRSVTRVDQSLLQDTPVRFVASATIGTDHIDLEYLKQNDIGFANAPGCNAESASEYIINALFHLAERKCFDPFTLTAGVVGHGNVGSRVKRKLDALGIRCLVNDPPKQQAGDDFIEFVSLTTILEECDFITLHVPLTMDGDHPSYHLFDAARLGLLKQSAILFNAARGAVVDNRALSELLNQRDDLTVFLDTWENEPKIDCKLLQQVDLATPHIAGYSYEGKLRGTQMILDAAAAFYGAEPSWNMQAHLPEKQRIEVTPSNETTISINHLLQQHYPIQQDDRALRSSAELAKNERAAMFDHLRKNYPRRHEYPRFIVHTEQVDKRTAARIGRLGFQLSN